MEKLKALAADFLNDEIRAFRSGGGRVVGYVCLMTPPEVLDAAGFLPYRIKALGRGRTDLADARLSRFNCSFCRACLQLGLDGTYDFLDGLIETNGCDQLRGMFENWIYARNTAFFHYLKVPHTLSGEAKRYFESELRSYREAVAREAGEEITDEALWEAMDRQTRIRGLLRQLTALREADPPRVTGAETLIALCAEGSVSPKTYECLLRKTVDELSRRLPLERPRARLLFGGAATDEVELLADIESLGGAIVADTMCFGARLFWRQSEKVAVDSADRGDPIQLLVEQYLGASLCPRMVEEFPARLGFLIETIRRTKVDGVVLFHNKFCDIHGIENALLRLRLEERGVPVLTLEKEYGTIADRGRIRTRIQAFLERIGGQS